MSQMLWIIDPDPTSAQALRSAIDLLGPDVETYDHIPTSDHPPKAVLIAGSSTTESLQKWVGELRRMGGNDLLPITIIGGLENSAEALALGADHYLNAPMIVADLWDHLRDFLTLSAPNDPERELPLSRGHVDRSPDPSVASDTSTPTAEHSNESEPLETQPADAQDNDVGLGAPETTEDDPALTRTDDPVLESSSSHSDDGESEDEPQEDTRSADPFEASIDHRQSLDSRDTPSDGTQAPRQGAIERPVSDADITELATSDPSVDDTVDDPVRSDDQLEPSAHEDPARSEDYAAESHVNQPRLEDDNAEDLFGLKQPKEVKEMSASSAKAENKPLEWVEDRPTSATDLTADSAWGLDESEALAEPNTSGWDAPEAPASDSWDTEESGESDWGESNSAWGSEDDASKHWGGDSGSDDAWGNSGTWSSPPVPDQARSNLSQLGQQLMPPELKPHAPVSPLGQLHATGLLGLIARCGLERVSGRVTWHHDSESIIMHLHDGRLKALDSALFDHDLLQAALAQGWIDTKELTGVQHLMQRRHSTAASVLAREGIKSSDAIQQLAQDTAERILLRCANVPGGYAHYHPEMDFERAVAVSQADTTSRVITLCESLVEGSLWTALVGGDDAIPTVHSTALPQNLPGREALHSADGARSLLELATSHGVAIKDVRSGCLAALVLGQLELMRVGVSSIQQSHRPDQTFERALKQIRSGNYFTVLGLPEAHSAAEVHRAFAARVSLLRLHLHANHPRFAEAYQELEEAREVLLDPDLRAQYRSANPQPLER